MKLIICGGGHGAHTLAGVLSMNKNSEVTVLIDYKDRADRWNNVMAEHGFCVNFRDGEKIIQEPGCVKFSVTKDVRVVENADYVLICLPAYAHESCLKSIVPYLPDYCSVVGIPGQPGFEYQCLFFLEKYYKSCNIMSLASLPWSTRIIDYGKEVMVIGSKYDVGTAFIKRNNIAASEAIESLQTAFGKVPVLHHCHVLALTLTTSLHPPIMYSRWKDWDGAPLDTQPLYFHSMDKEGAETLDVLTNEIIAISTAIKQRFPNIEVQTITSAHQWLIQHYGDQIQDKSSLLASLHTNKAYDGLKHPVIRREDGKYVPDLNYRYLSEDVPYGLVVHRAIADLVNVKTPVMDKIIEWAQTKLGRVYLVGGKLSSKDSDFTRLPQSYGIDSIETLVKMFK